jgi:lysophospholipase L1-like esterase
LGDSVLQNKLYATESQDVYTLLKERKDNNNIQSYAVDNSKIVDVYSQIDNLPFDLNSNTFIFLSIGGNDLLSATDNGTKDTLEPTFLGPIFAAYKNLIKSIRVRAPNVNLVLLDIYYPYGIKYQAFYPIIKKWNNLLYSFVEDREKRELTNLIGLLKISSILTDKSDFTLGIEPSDTGGQKIANSITTYLANHQYD